MPKMGMTVNFSAPVCGMADVLFTGTQHRVLAPLFGQPTRSFYASELISLAGMGSGAVQRELAKLAGSGLVTVRTVGNQKHFQANRDAPIFDELKGIVDKTFGLAEPLRQALQPLSKKIAAAFVFGSVAKESDTASSDIDLLVAATICTTRTCLSHWNPSVPHLGAASTRRSSRARSWRNARSRMSHSSLGCFRSRRSG
ncbi:nucleotidyltransferase domain-containing protein [Piscinibacter sakaiensis]|uniref:nucleotidyltransferase domain-containing protein n=1 Tax=Piscinibacter sakaiensis TaxID=1547922 RepID=UPI003AAD2A41